MTINIKFMRYVVVALALLLIAMIAGRNLMNESRYAALCTEVIDAQGHGPDEHSDEWWQSCYHQILVGTWLARNAETNMDEGIQLHPDRKLSYVNVDAMIGDRWELTSELALRLWSKSENSAEPVSHDYEILNMNGEMLILKPRGVEVVISYNKKSAPQ